MSKIHPDVSNYPGMVKVSKAAFFATVGKLDVHPTPKGAHDRVLGYLSHWKLRDGRLIGYTVGGTCFAHDCYMVTQAFFDANRAAIQAAG